MFNPNKMVSLGKTSMLCLKSVAALTAAPGVRNTPASPWAAAFSGPRSVAVATIQNQVVSQPEILNGKNPEIKEGLTSMLKNENASKSHSILNAFFSNDLFIEKLRSIFKLSMKNDSEVKNYMARIFANIRVTQFIEVLLQETVTAEEEEYIAGIVDNVKTDFRKILEEEPECVLVDLRKAVSELCSLLFANIPEEKIQRAGNLFYKSNALRNLCGFLLLEMCSATQTTKQVEIANPVEAESPVETEAQVEAESSTNKFESDDPKSIEQFKTKFRDYYRNTKKHIQVFIKGMSQAAIQGNDEEFDAYFNKYIDMLKKKCVSNDNATPVQVLN